MEEESKLYGNLFGVIELLNEEHLDALLTTMDKEHSLFYIIEAVKSAHKRGAFTIGETEVISKAIRTISNES
jgi:hypothetical protein